MTEPQPLDFDPPTFDYAAVGDAAGRCHDAMSEAARTAHDMAEKIARAIEVFRDERPGMPAPRGHGMMDAAHIARAVGAQESRR